VSSKISDISQTSCNSTTPLHCRTKGGGGGGGVGNASTRYISNSNFQLAISTNAVSKECSPGVAEGSVDDQGFNNVPG